ncbi:MAG TPA: hypothetical protein VFE45_14975 [Coriobacteriia bacterium]|nr:hypothetical protein [Coriobacteriia bacterium]
MKVAALIVKHRRAIMGVTALLVIAGVWGVMNGRINYDLLSYLPEDLESVQGFGVLNDDFGLANTVQLLVRGESDATVATLTERLRAIEGVKQVH